MYLISIYFDEEANQKISSYMRKIAEVTGNYAMIDGEVPPHITISSFDTDDEEAAKTVLMDLLNIVDEKEALTGGKVFFASVGSFVPRTLFLAPVLNEYLQNLQEVMYASLEEHGRNSDNWKISRQYRPYSWFPHTTLAKKLEKEEIVRAFEMIQNEFTPFYANVVRIGLAISNPYEDILNIPL